MRAKRKTTESFINQANLKHNFRYDYSLSEYKGCLEPVKIICKLHGEFLQKPAYHLSKNGCPICAGSPDIGNRKSNTLDFIEKAKIKHNNFYTYENVKYINAKAFVSITCPIHGEFLQRPNYHLSGNGCTLCYKENNNFGKSKFIHSCRIRNVGSLYVIKCFSEKESFIKIGITSQSIKDRFKRFDRFPYKYEIIYEEVDTPENIFNKEKYYHRLFKANRYSPMILFKGSTECFNIEIEKYDFKGNAGVT